MTATTGTSTVSSLGGSPHRRADVQGMRAVAVLVVVAFHAGLPLAGGFVGVDIFFVISGFVITALILGQASQGRFSLRNFFARRAKRLMPALALMVVVVFVLSFLLQSPFGPQQVTAQTGIGAMFLVANAVILRTVGGYFDAAAEANPLLHTWSLSVEEQFYLVFPLLVLLAAWWGRRRWGISRSLVVITTILCVISLAISIGFSYGLMGLVFTSQPEAWAFYSPFARVWEFGVGALVAAWWHGRTEAPPGAHRLALPMAVTGAILLVISVLWINESMAFPGIVAAVPVLGTAMLITAGGLRSNPINAALATRPMAAIGDMSYSIYLWHWPIILFAVELWPGERTALLAAAFSFLPAYLAYRFVEQPIRNRSLTSPLRVLAVAVSTSVVVLGLGLLLITIGPRSVPYANQPDEPTLGTSRGCLLMDTSFTPADIERCRFPVPAAKGWILLTGDSHAESFSDAVITAGNNLGYDVVSLTGADCTFVRGNEATGRVDNCPAMAAALLDTVHSADPPSLIVSAQRGVPADMGTTFAEITAAGVPIVRIEDVPMWRPWAAKQGPDPCQGGYLNFSCELPIEQVRANAAADKAAEAAVIAPYPGIVSVDPWPGICGDAMCSAIIDGRLAYRDASHLNRWGSEAMTARISAAMQAALAD